MAEIRAVLEAFVKFDKAIRPYLRKAAVKGHKEVIRAKKELMAAAAKEWLKVVRGAVDVSKIKAGGGDAMVEGLADWAAIEEAGRKIYGKVVLDIMQAAGLALSARQRAAVLKARTDPIGQAAVKWARKNTARLVTEVIQSTKNGIKGAVARSINAGNNLYDTQKLIKPMIGLTEKQTRAALSRYEKALAQGFDEQEAMDDMADYSRRALNDRAELIAQTETAAASAEGLLSAYEENDIGWAEWAADLGPGCCDKCTALDGQTFSIEEASGMLPAHPDCECAWIYGTQKMEKWDEADHPRDESGRFGEGGGGGEGARIDANLENSLDEFAANSAGSLKERVVIINRKDGRVLADHVQELRLGTNLENEAVQGTPFSNADMFDETGNMREDRSITFIHTHPENQSFSEGDWRMFGGRGSIEEMRAYAPNGKYTLTKTDEFMKIPWQERTPRKITNVYNKKIGEVETELRGMPFSNEYVEKVLHETSKKTAEHFKIKYSFKGKKPK
jgi:hypothetical protein